MRGRRGRRSGRAGVWRGTETGGVEDWRSEGVEERKKDEKLVLVETASWYDDKLDHLSGKGDVQVTLRTARFNYKAW